MRNEDDTLAGWKTVAGPGGEAGSAPEGSRPGPEDTLAGWTTVGGPEGIFDDGRTNGGRRWKAGETILGRYVVERELGQGGMGVVYECLDTVGGVKVAVKCLPPELSHNSVEMEEVRENFELVVGLRHPNIAGVRTLEKDGRGEYFLVMDVAEGESLRKWMRRKWKEGGVGLGEAVGVLKQVASALDYAHGEKIVHRDVKPGNVMIDGRGRVKVLDFGLAAQIRTSLSRASQAYRGTSGTGPYMAPEQWRGRPQDGKTDQYALGVMAYEMLAGRLPFENSELAVLRETVLKEQPETVPGLPEGTMEALRRALAKTAEGRFGSCGAFVAALEGRNIENSENRRATIESRHAGRVEGSRGGDVFLRIVRVEKELASARKEEATGEEKAELERVGELFSAGERAVRAGDREAAGGLFEQCEAALGAWKEGVAARKERERAAEEKRRAAAARAEAERLERERRAEVARRAEEEQNRRAYEAAREVEAKAARARNAKIAAWVAVFLLMVYGIGYWSHAREEAARRAERQRQEEARKAEEQRQEEARRAEKQQREKALAAAKAAIAGLGQGVREGEERSVRLPGGVELSLVWCPPGSFRMGSENGDNDEKPEHEVTLSKGFWMGKTEVTQAQWKSVMGGNPSYHTGDDLPVENVSWHDATNFCGKLGMRLPTEAEWEYACRAGSTGDYAERIDQMAWYGEGSSGQTHPVGKKKANAWGLHDMHGNVWEWCEDWYDGGYYAKSPGRDPAGPASGVSRVLRGGCSWDFLQYYRSALRDRRDPGDRFWDLGFRPVARQD